MSFIWDWIYKGVSGVLHMLGKVIQVSITHTGECPYILYIWSKTKH